ncbi:MAG TPA: type II toxin-antitoxin system VapC family toxin [Alphaproteobacteria bacterium]|nr:type II toxin-antitoxin system VapC family toxin [Alphaproteobacteria bacterium]
MTLVLDSSVTLAWLYADELTAPVQQVLDRIVMEQACAPSIWRLEVANSLQMAVRRRRIDATFRDAALAGLASLDIITDSDTDIFAWSTTLRLADRFSLTLYDAAYLELAQRKNLPLATLDRDLRSVGAALGILLLGA